jgi:protein-tyrosine phosphatase
VSRMTGPARVDAPRELRWPDCRNARHLGDLPLVGGGRTRDASLVRADSLARLNADGVAALHAYGIRAVIDLRETRILDRYPYPPGLRAAVRYHHIPLLPANIPLPLRPAAYGDALHRSAWRLAEVVRAIAGEPDGCVFHCHSGTGRTGLVALVLQALAGVEPDAIVADHLGDGAGGAPDDDRAAAVLRLLGELAGTRGTAAFLRACGATPGDIETVRRRLVDGMARP